VLERRLTTLGREPVVEVVFRNLVDMRARVRIREGEPVVEVDAQLCALHDEVDHEFVRRALDPGQPRTNFERARAGIRVGGETSLNAVAVAVHGPRTSPSRTTHQYSANVEYSLDRVDLGDLLGVDWVSAAGASAPRISIRDAATAARAAGLLEGVAVGHDRPGHDEVDDEVTSEDHGVGDRLSDWDGVRNEIWFGPPGTGKSFGIGQRIDALKIEPERTRRITFHPETSYYDLVGTYRPMVKWLDDSPRPGQSEPRTYYGFAPGPLSELLALAASSPHKMHALIIEEINRGNCAAIFGDVFQLLDRHESSERGATIGESAYGITASPEWGAWLGEKITVDCRIFEPGTRTLRLPPNLLLLASMNTADQNLFPMDSAFKRRWAMRYVPISKNEGPDARVPLRAQDGVGVPWRTFFTVINVWIVEYTKSDDKQIGPWFVHAKNGGWLSAEVFCSKVLHYLWTDVFRGDRAQIFRSDVTTYDVLVQRFRANQHVLADDVLNALGAARENAEPVLTTGDVSGPSSYRAV
jgi:hypothetical protein